MRSPLYCPRHSQGLGNTVISFLPLPSPHILKKRFSLFLTSKTPFPSPPYPFLQPCLFPIADRWINLRRFIRTFSDSSWKIYLSFCAPLMTSLATPKLPRVWLPFSCSPPLLFFLSYISLLSLKGCRGSHLCLEQNGRGHSLGKKMSFQRGKIVFTEGRDCTNGGKHAATVYILSLYSLGFRKSNFLHSSFFSNPHPSFPSFLFDVEKKIDLNEMPPVLSPVTKCSSSPLLFFVLLRPRL